MKEIMQAYAVDPYKGFQITHMLFDEEFLSLGGTLSTLHVTLNSGTNDEHVTAIEHFIRALKKWT